MIFNRAVAASQAFSRKFPELDAQLGANKKLPIEAWPDAPRRWLENGLLGELLGFIQRATDAHWALDIAIYEYQLQAIVDKSLFVEAGVFSDPDYTRRAALLAEARRALAEELGIQPGPETTALYVPGSTILW